MKKLITNLFLTTNGQALLIVIMAFLLCALLQNIQMEKTDYKKNIDQTLIKRKYNPDYTPTKEDNILIIGNRHVGSLQNFCVFSGLP